MNFLNLLKGIFVQSKPYKYKDVLHIWEDDYYMVELLPKENLDFLKKEIRRIDEFGKENFDDAGFNGITLINEKPFKTLEEKIPINEVINIFKESGLSRIQSIVIQGIGFIEGEKVPIAFGRNKFGVIIECNSKYLEHIWITGSVHNNEDQEQLKIALFKFGHKFGFFGINWFKSDFYDLTNEKQIEKFIKEL